MHCSAFVTPSHSGSTGGHSISVPSFANTFQSYMAPSRTFFRREIYCKAKFPSLLTAITEQEDDAREEPRILPSTLREMIPKLHSYATNIRRTRRIMTGIQVEHPVWEKNSNHDEDDDNDIDDDQMGKSPKVKNTVATFPLSAKQPSPASMSAVRSLVYTLEQEIGAWTELYKMGDDIISTSIHKSESHEWLLSVLPIPDSTIMEFRENLNHALIQALRASSDHGDYMIISKIVQVAIQYCEVLARISDQRGAGESSNRNRSMPLLEARFFGEAISEMGKTKAGHSKLKKLWLMFMTLSEQCEKDQNEEELGNSSCILASKPSAFELNAMLSALGSRGKVRVALNLYKEVTKSGMEDGSGGSSIHIECDEYTASTLLNILATSIESENVVSSSHNISSIHDANVGSPCWQWSEALSILNDFEKNGKINNHVYCAALQVNEQAMALYRFPGNKHSGSKSAMSILERMKARKISPDVITCSFVMSTFDKGKQWKAALALLRAMEKPEEEKKSEAYKSGWTLPTPNVYTYASVISSCARARQYDEAITVLDRIRNNAKMEDNNSSIRLNTWIYNSALASCVPTSKDVYKSDKRYFDLAGQIIHRMSEDVGAGFDCTPDVVTFNTLLSVIRGIREDQIRNSSFHDFIIQKKSKDDSEYGHKDLVMDILDTMSTKKIAKDPGTYHNAIMSCELCPEASLHILDLALEDYSMLETSKYDEWGSTDRIRLYLINTALSVCGAKGRIDLVSKIFSYLKVFNIEADSDSMIHVIKSLSPSGKIDDSMIFLNAMKGDGAANSQCIDKYGIDVIGSGITSSSPIIEERHYSAAIAGCLRCGQLFPALKILNAMKLHNMRPNPASLQGIILAYCKLATDEATYEFKQARREYAKGKARGPIFRPDHTKSHSRATAALAMMRSMPDATVKLKCVVASACAATGMWYEAQQILWELHILAVQEKKRERSEKVYESDLGSAIAELPRLHRSLLKLCARSGNVTAALCFVDTIQDLKSKFEKASLKVEKFSNYNALVNNTETLVPRGASNHTIPLPIHGIGMTGEDWKLLMISASKSAHWKVCLGTLAFLQPYVEATHPKFSSKGTGTTSIRRLNKEYEKLSRALTAAVLAFEIRSQYAWALRSMYDWMEWSGRRPPREAVFATCRILAMRGKSNEVTSLVTQILEIDDVSRRRKSNVLSYETSYEMALYIETISILYSYGFYDAADELYLDAISNGFLPFSIMTENSKSQFEIDLHGMNRAVAHSAVRVALQHFIQSKKIDRLEQDVLIITGRGNSSQKHLRPVLRPEVQRMLVEEFYPPLGTSSLPNNMGALKISAHDMNSWINHQQEQKGARFLAVASALKSITTGSRLKTILSTNLRRFPSSSNMNVERDTLDKEGNS